MGHDWKNQITEVNYAELRENSPDTQGMRPYGWDAATAERVMIIRALGVPEHRVAFLVGCSPAVLKKRYAAELELGLDRANEEVARSLFYSAIKGNVAAQIFWLKAKAGWRVEDEEKSRRKSLAAKDLKICYVDAPEPT